MGCFLTVTGHDLAQLQKSLKAGVSKVSYEGSGVLKIQVNSVANRSAREMARIIRQNAKSAHVTTGTTSDAQKAVAMKERMQYQMATLMQTAPALFNVYSKQIQEAYKGEMRHFGKKKAEMVAATILEQSGYTDKTVRITSSKGVDIKGQKVKGTFASSTVIAEVKFSAQDKDFGKMMSKGSYKDAIYPDGLRQMSDPWLKKVDPDLDPAKANILGVHINPSNETVTIYRRLDAEATRWKPLMTAPLSDFDLSEYM